MIILIYKYLLIYYKIHLLEVDPKAIGNSRLSLD